MVSFHDGFMCGLSLLITYTHYYTSVRRKEVAMAGWTNEETKTLLELWSAADVQAQLNV